MLSMQKEGAAHRNIRDIAVRCTFMLSFKSQSTNILVRCTCCLEVILFDVRFKNRGNLVTTGCPTRPEILFTLFKPKTSR
jgi:hypothetical protein